MSSSPVGDGTLVFPSCSGPREPAHARGPRARVKKGGDMVKRDEYQGGV
jgi:hypothetical protein